MELLPFTLLVAVLVLQLFDLVFEVAVFLSRRLQV